MQTILVYLFYILSNSATCRTISASTRGAWKRHVFGDLRPYTCLFERCVESNTDFDRRHWWQLHISQYHWRTWSYPFKCGSMFPSAVELGDPVRHHYLPNASDEHLSTVVARGEVSVSSDVTKECPLCRQAISGLKSYVKHTGRHLNSWLYSHFPVLKMRDWRMTSKVMSRTMKHLSWELSRPMTTVEMLLPNLMSDVTAGETPDGEAPRPSAASPISYGEPVIEPGPDWIQGNDRPIDTRFARRHLSLETLRTCNVDFDFDADPDCVLVKRWVPECEQDLMLKHTNASVRNGSKINWRRRQAGGSRQFNKPLADSSNPRKLKPEGDIGSLSGNLSNDSEDYHDNAGGHITSNARRLRRRVQGTSLAFHDPPPDTKLGEQQLEGGVSENVSGRLPINDEEVDGESLLLRREQLRRLQKTQRRALSF
ncbi:Uncharacterized protein HZ326_17226 [Fusarium oxysporum f. sp. albedinis]|nr:Uncharacterized protein HZ326_17226 [Fusarium oxysporum f. sp. albedinis]